MCCFEVRALCDTRTRALLTTRLVSRGANKQAASRANIKGIAAQSKSLAEARAAREEAVNLSRVKSTFLATMVGPCLLPLTRDTR